MVSLVVYYIFVEVEVTIKHGLAQNFILAKLLWKNVLLVMLVR